MKRLVTILLVLTLLFSLVAIPVAGGAQELDEYRITLLVQSTDVQSSLDTYAGKLIYEKFKVVFDYEVYTGDYVEKTNLMLAGGDYGDVVNIWWDNNLANWIDAGAVIPLDDYLADMPNFTKLHEARIPLWRMSAADGKLYKWESDGSVVQGSAPLNDLYVRADVLEAMDYPQPVSADGWVEFIKKAKELFPTTPEGVETIGITVPLGESWGFALNQIFNEKAVLSGALGGTDCAQWDPVNETFVDMVTPYMKENVQFFNKLWRENLLDRECFSSTLASIGDKQNTGIPLVVFYIGSDAANSNLKSAGKEAMSYVPMPIESNAQAAENAVRNLGVWHSNSFVSYAITDKCRDPKRLTQVLDWCSSPEGLAAIGWGEEGVNYTVENGMKVPTEAMLEICKNGEFSKQGIGYRGNPYSGFVMGATEYEGQPICIEYDPTVIKLRYNDTEKKVLEAYGIDTFKDFWHGKPLPSTLREYFYVVSAATLPVESDLVKQQEKIVQNRNGFMADLIKAPDDATFEAIWESFMQKHEALHPEEVIAAKNAQLAEFKARYEAQK